MFPDPSINFGERSGRLWPSESVFGFRQQFDRLLAFVDRVFFPSQASEHSTEMRVTSGIMGRFTHESLGYRSSLLERCMRPFFIALM